MSNKIKECCPPGCLRRALANAVKVAAMLLPVVSSVRAAAVLSQVHTHTWLCYSTSSILQQATSQCSPALASAAAAAAV